MARITYIDPAGAARTVEVPDGWTVMQGATANAVAGIEAECGGSCSCATCHVYVEAAPVALPPPNATEADLLEEVAAERRPTSRLSCQIKVGAALDGLVVRLPERQS